MKKCFCDRCGKELDYYDMNYVGLSVTDYGNKKDDGEHWDFCQVCASSIKHAIVFDIAQYERKGKG